MPGGGLPRTPPGGPQRGAEEEKRSQEEGKGPQGDAVSKGAEGKLMANINVDTGVQEAPPPILRNPSPAGHYDPPELKDDKDVRKKKVGRTNSLEERKEGVGKNRRNSTGEVPVKGASGKGTNTQTAEVGKKTKKPPGKDDKLTLDNLAMDYAFDKFTEGSKRQMDESPNDQGVSKKKPKEEEEKLQIEVDSRSSGSLTPPNYG